MPYELFWTLNPRLLKSFEKAYENEQKIADEYAWRQGIYFLRAVSTAIDASFNGRKATTSYPNAPFGQTFGQSKAQTDELSDEEMTKNHKALFAYLGVMKTNFELEHPEKKRRPLKSEVVTHG